MNCEIISKYCRKIGISPGQIGIISELHNGFRVDIVYLDTEKQEKLLYFVKILNKIDYIYKKLKL